jgi:phospholipase C
VRAAVRLRRADEALKLDIGRSVSYQPDVVNPKGYLLPFHLDTHTSSAQAIPSTSHAWSVQHEAWNGGKMDRWLPAHRKADGVNGPYVMGYYTREDIPFQFALAETFTVCDHYFCSVFGPTWPNRLYWMTGTIDPGGTRGAGPRQQGADALPVDDVRGTAAGGRGQLEGVPAGRRLRLQHAGAVRELPRGGAGVRPVRAGVRPQPEGTFEDDARNDRLPAVSWIMPTSFQSEHPDYLPAAGADFVASKIEAIGSNPKVWRKTPFILNYDENDGLFDHVPPPTPPAGTPDEFVQGLPIGGGFRVPAIIVSPWTAGGWVASEAFDHTSAFRFSHGRPRPPRLPDDTAEQLEKAKEEVATLPKPTLPGADQSVPGQEKGHRPHV